MSTTGKLVAPPLHVTRTLILPNLFHALCDYVASLSPDVVKDWWRIFTTSTYHFFTVVGTTDRGKQAQSRFLALGASLVDCLSSPAFRQIIIDGAAALVKSAKLLDTPEFEDLLQQLTLFACRFGSGHVQQFLHDSNAFTVALTKLLADPHTTMALAEVTAYICYALERQEGRKVPRKERDTYQKRTNQERSTVQDSTVEQAILSSLGMDVKHEKEEEDPLDDASSSIFQGSIRKQVEDNRSTDGSVPFHEKVKCDVDVGFLREHIVNNPPLRVNVPSRVTGGDDIEDLDFDDSDVPVRSRVSVGVPDDDWSVKDQEKNDKGDDINDDVWVRHEHPMPLENEQPLQHFYRILDETLVRKRKEAINEIIETNRHAPIKLLKKGKVYKKKDENVSFKEQLELLKAEFTTQLGGSDQAKLAKIERLVLRNKQFVYIGLVLVFLFILLWGGLGFYGLYVYFSPTLLQVIPNGKSNGETHEVVIKVIREVVHIDATGNEVFREDANSAEKGGGIAKSILDTIKEL